MSKALVFLAEGFEEIEACTIIDILRRCGVSVTVAGLSYNSVEGAHGITVIPDKEIQDVSAEGYDVVICPGGAPGFINLRKNKRVLNIIKEAYAAGKLVAAICAAPAVLADAGVLNGKRCTIYPGMEDELERGGGIPSEGFVIDDGTIVTSKAPATALAFALKLGEKLAGEDVATEVAKATLADLALKG
jgi:4-methyl-5(b-hydroxyethyl)-thiazole monophosphate biosynthesis